MFRLFQTLHLCTRLTLPLHVSPTAQSAYGPFPASQPKQRSAPVWSLLLRVAEFLPSPFLPEELSAAARSQRSSSFSAWILRFFASRLSLV